jgi:mRNA interferase RelE/StbE
MRRLNLSRDAEKSLGRAPKKLRLQLAHQLLALRENPRPDGAKKLTGSEYLRVRVGDYRVVYIITADTIDIVLVEKRDSVYKKLRRR